MPSEREVIVVIVDVGRMVPFKLADVGKGGGGDVGELYGP